MVAGTLTKFVEEDQSMKSGKELDSSIKRGEVKPDESSDLNVDGLVKSKIRIVDLIQ